MGDPYSWLLDKAELDEKTPHRQDAGRRAIRRADRQLTAGGHHRRSAKAPAPRSIGLLAHRETDADRRRGRRKYRPGQRG